MSARRPSAPTPRSDFRRRLGYFLIGLAIGCVMVGMLFSMRAKMVGGNRAGQEPASPNTQPATPMP